MKNTSKQGLNTENHGSSHSSLSSHPINPQLECFSSAIFTGVRLRQLPQNFSSLGNSAFLALRMRRVHDRAPHSVQVPLKTVFFPRGIAGILYWEKARSASPRKTREKLMILARREMAVRISRGAWRGTRMLRIHARAIAMKG